MMIITGGEYKSRKLIVPDENITRPTLSKIRMGVFNTLFSILGNFDELSFLDLFGGSGVMGLEALSRGFKEIVVCEKNPKAAQIIKKNYSTLGLKPDLFFGDSLKYLKTCNRKFDVIYIDPPYESQLYEKVLPMLPECKIIIAEHSNPIEINKKLIKTKNYGGKIVSFYSFI